MPRRCRRAAMAGDLRSSSRGNDRIWRGAQEAFFFIRPRFGLQMVFLQAQYDPVGFDRIQTAPQTPGQFLVRDFAHQLFFRASPEPPAQWTERWNAECNALFANARVAATKAAGQFAIIETAQEPNLSRRPAARRRGQADAQAFALGNNFMDGASGAAGKDRVGHFAELLQFSQRP